MKSNIKKKSTYGISILILVIILIMIPTGMAAVTVERTIKNSTLTAGNSTNVTVAITNDGTQRSLSLLETIPSGWTMTDATNDADTNKITNNIGEWVWFKIDPGSPHLVIYTITVPSSATDGVYNINGSMMTDNITSATGESTITVINNVATPTPTPTPTPAPANESQSFDLVVNPASATVNIGANALYTLTITNTGTAEDTYSITTNMPTNSTVNLANGSVTVGPGGSADIEMTVSGSSIGDYAVNVIATSGANASNSKEVTTTTSVTETSTVDDFKLTVSPTTMTINVGASATYTLTVSNIGSAEDTYSLVANKPDNATVELASNSVTVGQGNTSDVALTVSGSVTGTYTVNVTATSGLNTSNVKEVTTTTNVEVAAPPSSGRSSGGGSSSGGTYPTFTATPVKTPNSTVSAPTQTTVVPTVTVVSTTARPTEAVKETPIDMTTTKGSPGFEIVLAIGMLGAIYILRRMK